MCPYLSMCLSLKVRKCGLSVEQGNTIQRSLTIVLVSLVNRCAN